MTREEFQTERTRIISEMLDNPDEYGIYPTTKCFEQLDALFDSLSLPPAEGAVPDNAAEQNKRMREWFKERTGLDDTLLSIHMEQIDVMLKGVQQQPTAEGAEQRIRVRNILQDFYRRGEYELEQAEEDIMRLFQQQPTAEGAEEILERAFNNGAIRRITYIPDIRGIISAMNDFATLHAQRIAEKMKEANQFILDIAGVLGIKTDGVGFDGLTLSIDDFKEAAEKMVSERLRNELMRYDQWLLANDMGQMFDDTMKCVDEYLKTREK